MRHLLFGLTMVAALTASGMAQIPPGQTPGRIEQRKQNQQQRIVQGVKSGELTAHEAARIERNEAKIDREVRAERKANSGHLTNQQKAQVDRQQSRVSKQIYKQKHDGQHQPR